MRVLRFGVLLCFALVAGACSNGDDDGTVLEPNSPMEAQVDITPEPTPAQPATPEPTPAQPVTSEPTPAQPVTSEPTPAQLATPEPTPEQAGVIVVATDAAVPEQNFFEDGIQKGWEFDLVNAVCWEAGWSCQWEITEWDGMLDRLADGVYDMVAASVSATPERAKLVDFTVQYTKGQRSMFVVAANGELAEGRVGVQTGTVQESQVWEPVVFPGAEDPVLAVISGEIESALVPTAYGLDMIAKHEGLLERAGPFLPIPDGIAMAFTKGLDEVVARASEIITAMIEDGRFDQMYSRYTGSQHWGNWDGPQRREIASFVADECGRWAEAADCEQLSGCVADAIQPWLHRQSLAAAEFIASLEGPFGDSHSDNPDAAAMMEATLRCQPQA